MRLRQIFVFIFLLLAAGLSACQGDPGPAAGGPLRVLATTTIVADVVQNVGGNRVQVETLLPVGTDPHSFEPTPQDLAKAARASLIFSNGAGLEEFLQRLLESAGGPAENFPVSAGIELAQASAPESGDEDHSGGDPHTWFDPTLVVVWVGNIQTALSEADPAHAADYAANAGAYTQKLKDLDAWIQEQVQQIPPEARKLVTDHTSFTYFARRYGFELAGAVVPGYSTLAQPSAQELAALEDAIRSLGVKAVFVGETVNPTLEERVAQDTGTRLVHLYNGSLSKPDGPAATYLDFMRYNVNAIVNALK